MNPMLLSARITSFFAECDARIIQFQNHYAIRCLPGCGTCCEYPSIRASILEFIPLACKLWDTGRAEQVYRELNAAVTICPFYIDFPDGPVKGRCSEYAHRGLICRIFGFMSVREHGSFRFSSCAFIKQLHKETLGGISSDILGQCLPTASELRKKFAAIDPELARPEFHIVMAIKRAVEYVYSRGYKPQTSAGVPRAA